MNVRKSVRHWILAGILSVMISGCLLIYILLVIPNYKISRAEWLNKATHDQIREVCHRVLRFSTGNHHDAFLYLSKIGNVSSVPVLINALKWHEVTGSDDFIECTTQHCLDALYSLTGVRAGKTHDAWSDWWKQHGLKLPSSHFFPRHDVSLSDHADNPNTIKPVEGTDE